MPHEVLSTVPLPMPKLLTKAVLLVTDRPLRLAASLRAKSSIGLVPAV